jgi:glycosyltransferase involved in cell wall biosynthesis
VLIICRKPNDTAPFRFKYVHPSVVIKDRASFSYDELLKQSKEFNPDLVFLAGWAHKPYLTILKTLNPKYSVLGFDNQWTGSLKQRLGALYFKMFLKSHIRHAFVPGQRQRLFAGRLGFESGKIIEGAYCCDYELFHSYGKSCSSEKANSYPRRFLFAGRYVKEKGITDLWNVFIELDKEQPSEWELWCLGKGDITPVKHEKIRHFGFKQPEEMMEIIKNTGIFVLPSTFEPWGVVVHEFASAGFPLLCTDSVGAGDRFIENNSNGFVIKAGDREALKNTMRKFMAMSQQELVKMSQKSTEIASALTPEVWAANLMKACI